MPKAKIQTNSVDASQWVMLIKDEALKDEDSNSPTFCKLRHPRSNTGAMFLFSNADTKVFEVSQFKEEFRSWFIGNTVQEDGSLFLTIEVNPVFLMLHYLIQESKDGNFKPLDQMVLDEDYPECNRLCTCANPDELQHVADMKGSDDLKVFKYNQEKALSWLKQKVDTLATQIKDRRMNVRGKMQAMTFVKADTSMEDYVRYAHGMVSEYLPVQLSHDLKSHMGIKDPAVLHEKPTIDEPNAKRQKKDVQPIDDFSDNSTNNKNSKTAPKLTNAQKKLSKVDKSGMKSISSFFSPKGK